MKYFFLLTTLFFTHAYPQLSIQAVVCNQLKEPLPYTNVVSLKKQNGTLTNESGKFQLSNIGDGDSLKVTNVSYQTLIIPANKILSTDTLFLNDGVKQLNEISITDLKKYRSEKRIGFYDYSANGEFKLKPGNQIAVFIQDTSTKAGMIKGIFFKLKQKGRCNNSLRIRILNTSSSASGPFLDILHENVILTSEQLKLNNYVDLTDQRILMPPEGMFIIVDFLYPETDCQKQSYTSISANMKEESNLVWLNFRDRKWNHYLPKLPNENYMTPSISVKVAY